MFGLLEVLGIGATCLFFGGCIGVLVTALCVASSNYNRNCEALKESKGENK